MQIGLLLHDFFGCIFFCSCPLSTTIHIFHDHNKTFRFLKWWAVTNIIIYFVDPHHDEKNFKWGKNKNTINLGPDNNISYLQHISSTYIGAYNMEYQLMICDSTFGISSTLWVTRPMINSLVLGEEISWNQNVTINFLWNFLNQNQEMFFIKKICVKCGFLAKQVLIFCEIRNCEK